MSKLIGTPQLTAYMHGYFVPMKTYTRLRALADPEQFEQYKKKKIEEKLAKESEGRIKAKRKLPKVNAKLAQKLSTEMDKKKAQTGANVLGDNRWDALWNNEDFKVDETSDR